MEHHSTSKRTVLTRLLYITMAFAWLVTVAQPVDAQVEPTGKTPPQAEKIPLFATPDDSSALVDEIERNEVLTPMAETLGAGGIKWYLVKTKSGVVGWIKAGDTDESKKLDSFFKSLPPEPSVSTTLDIRTTSSTSAPRGAIIVPVHMNGPRVIVPVTLNDSVRTYLLLDTGATSTMVSRRVASDLALHQLGTTMGFTVGGVITVPMARLGSLKVGEAEVPDLIVAIHDFSRDPRYEGLLGMDFLRRFQVSLDPKRQVLILAPR